MRYSTIILKAVLTVFMLVLAVPSFAFTEDDNTWKERKVCVFGMPYIGSAVGEHGSGLLTSILKAVYRPEKMDFYHVQLPYKRALDDLRKDEIQCSLDIKGNRKEFVQAKTTLAFYDLSAAYMRKTKWEGTKSLEGKKVAYLHGFDIENFVPVKIRPQMVYDLSSAYHMLDRGHVAYILDDNLLLKDAMFDSKLPTNEFVITKIKSFEVRPIFSNNENGKLFRDIYDRRMKEMFKTGEFARIMQEHKMSETSIKRVMDANK